MNSTDIIAYQFNADLYHPACMVMVFLGTAAARDEDAERVLSHHAHTMGIDRSDESTFDSEWFPKVVFADMTEPTDYCGRCRQSILPGYGEAPKPDRMDGWTYEGPDPSVGLFGEGWYHDSCPAGNDADSEVDADVTDLATVVTDVRNGTVTTFHMLTCLDCGQQRIITTTDYDPEVAQVYAAREFGTQKGHAAGGWAFDGNTPVETYVKVLRGYEDGDPAILDMEPAPLSGEWADGLTNNDVYQAAGHDMVFNIDDELGTRLLDEFCEAFSQAYWDEVVRRCRLHTTYERVDGRLIPADR